MVSVLDPGSSRPGSSPGQGQSVVRTLSQCLPPPRCTNGYRQPITLHPVQEGSRKIPSRSMLQKRG